MRLMNALFEQYGKVVDYCITPTDLLHELTGHSQHHASEMLRLPACENSLEWRSFSPGVARSADTVHNDLFLQLRFFIAALKAAEGSDNSLAFFVALACKKPARGLRKPDHADNKDKSEDNLEGDWEAPREIR